MHQLNQDSTEQVVPTPGGNAADDHLSDSQALRAECERLQQRVKQLEEARERDRQTLAAVQQEYEVHRRWEMARAKEYFLRIDALPLTEEEIVQMIREGKAVPFEEVIAELEQLGEES